MITGRGHELDAGILQDPAITPSIQVFQEAPDSTIAELPEK
jgi:hypothetical protein